MKMEPRLDALIKRLKPVAHVFKFKDETPPRIDAFLDVGAELRRNGKCTILTFWFHWDHDSENDDIQDWEPITYILKDNAVIDIQTRPHWNLVRWLTDQPILQNGERAIVFFSKNRHAPYLEVQPTTKVGWLKKAMTQTWMGREIGWAVFDFMDVMSERSRYVNIPKYKVKKNRRPPSDAQALTGMEIMGKKLFNDWYKKPESC